MSKRRWTNEESREALRRYPNEPTQDIAADMGRSPSAIYQHALKNGVYKSDEHNRRMQQQSARKLHESGRAHRFAAGQAPWNKGTHIDNGSWHRFEKGHRPWHARPIGSERVDNDGIKHRKIGDPRKWRPVHVLLWEEQNGPLPDGCVVVFANRDQSDIRIENLICISRAENMRRNTIHRYPAEMVSVIRQIGWMEKKLEEMK